MIPFADDFVKNAKGYVISDPSYKGKPAWALDDHCGTNDSGKKLIYAVVRCPYCCQLFTLMAHSIGADGEVNASILCSCNQWHVWGILGQWREKTGGIVKAANSLFISGYPF